MLPQWLSHILMKSVNLNRVAAGRVAATSTEGRKIFSQEALRGKTPHLDSTLSSRVKVEDDADLAAVRDFLRIFEAESWELPWSRPNNVSVPVWLTEVVDASRRVFSWLNDVDIERGATSGWRAPKAALRALCKAEAEEGRTMAGENDDEADSTKAEVGTESGTLRLGEGSWRNSVYFTIELFYVRVRQKGCLFGQLKLRGIRVALEDGRRVRGRPVGILWRTPVLVEEESYSLAGWRDEIYTW
eukprot:g5914.t1